MWAVGLVCFWGLIAIVGMLATESSVHSWYKTIPKSDLTPSNEVFAPVWTVLYVCIGTAGWLLSQAAPGKGRRWALVAYFGQGIANGIWSPLFFYLRSPAWACLDILILVALLVITVQLSWRVSRLASVLLLPYLGWTLFASYLNAIIVIKS
ncbi:MAG: TspO/MBR family protein [Chlamydiia bacterium]